MGKSHTKLTLVIVFLLSCVSAYAAGFANEKLHYVISYKWGLIHKDAGEALPDVRRQGRLPHNALQRRQAVGGQDIYGARHVACHCGCRLFSGLRTTRRFRTKAGNMAGRHNLLPYSGRNVTGIVSVTEKEREGQLFHQDSVSTRGRYTICLLYSIILG